MKILIIILIYLLLSLSISSKINTSSNRIIRYFYISEPQINTVYPCNEKIDSISTGNKNITSTILKIKNTCIYRLNFNDFLNSQSWVLDNFKINKKLENDVNFYLKSEQKFSNTFYIPNSAESTDSIFQMYSLKTENDAVSIKLESYPKDFFISEKVYFSYKLTDDDFFNMFSLNWAKKSGNQPNIKYPKVKNFDVVKISEITFKKNRIYGLVIPKYAINPKYGFYGCLKYKQKLQPALKMTFTLTGSPSRYYQHLNPTQVSICEK